MLEVRICFSSMVRFGGLPSKTGYTVKTTCGDLGDPGHRSGRTGPRFEHGPNCAQPSTSAYAGGQAILDRCGAQEARTACRSSWQNRSIERFIGTLQRELLDEEPVCIKLNGHPLDTVDRWREPHTDPLHVGWLTKHSRFTHDVDHPGRGRVVEG